ncbi:MAG: signal peptidase II [Lactobacillus sp.]|jgi:signal peptidase II|nr:signal peptidase II [Lactobacillus sp.]MCH3906294.1 signal peptidase II [Lactobacillus sp.]MCH3990131.1 signal peptidase II [Lactobacillus sp.]MCH4069155.1 signal peptidase II [Lactobacillus sp.]MCI1303858.1 signal peptidase II [Lactobacillus sp.]
MQALYLIISLIVILADQGLKSLIVNHWALGQVKPALPGLFSLTYLRNNGAAWNIFPGRMVFFYIISAVAIAIVLYYLFKQSPRSVLFSVGLSLVLGGIIGNLIDRIRYHYVVDMIQLDFMNFNIFNIADSAITVGIILIFIYLIFFEDKEKHD